MDDGAVEVALRREELSVVDAVLEFEVPLPLPAVSLRGNQAYPQRDQSLMEWKDFLPVIID